jgi:hypothetical protein
LLTGAAETIEENNSEKEAAYGITNLDEQYIDITPYLAMTQADAASKFGLPTSSLSKLWKESSNGRKWPCGAVSKLDSRIVQFLAAVAQDDVDKGKLSDNAEKQLAVWLQERAVLLKPITIRMTKKKK